MQIVCEHKADKNHVAVSAASVLAKSAREKEMDKLKEKYGSEIGSGYTSDPTTIDFLEKNADDHMRILIFLEKAGKLGKKLLINLLRENYFENYLY